jgi:DNA-binding transcriptional ArsR family regulator
MKGTEMSGGRPQAPGPRSFELLEFVARLDVASVEALQCAFALSRSVTYSHLRRLYDAGLVSRLHSHDQGSAVAVTRRGRQHLALPSAEVPTGAQYGLGLRHSQAVSWVAALLELRGRVWVSDREARVRGDWQVPVMWPSSRGTHRPDLGTIIEGERVAIEVERTQKGARRLRAILAGYEDAIAAGRLSGGVLYICQHATVRRVVEREAAAAGLRADVFRVRDLHHVVTDARHLAAQARDPSLTAGRFGDPGRLDAGSSGSTFSVAKGSVSNGGRLPAGGS